MFTYMYLIVDVKFYNFIDRGEQFSKFTYGRAFLLLNAAAVEFRFDFFTFRQLVNSLNTINFYFFPMSSLCKLPI